MVDILHSGELFLWNSDHDICTIWEILIYIVDTFKYISVIFSHGKFVRVVDKLSFLVMIVVEKSGSLMEMKILRCLEATFIESSVSVVPKSTVIGVA